MRLYDTALFLHMAGLVILFGGFFVSQRAASRIRSATNIEEARTWVGLLQSAAWMFPAGLALLLVSGLYMMFVQWRAPYPWITVGLIGLVIIGVVGGGVVARRVTAMSKAAESGVEGSQGLPGLLAAPGTWILTSTLNGLAFGIVWIMSTKPGWAGSIAAAVVGAALGFAFAQRPRSTSPGAAPRG